MSAELTPRRLFLHEPGWRVGLKVGSVKEYCYTMAPGQDYYHRICDGEIYLSRADERICVACAERRGLLAYEPRLLREPMSPIEIGAPDPERDGEAEEWSP